MASQSEDTARSQERGIEGEGPPGPSPSSPHKRAAGPVGFLAIADIWRERLETIVIGMLLGGAIGLVVYTALIRYIHPRMAPTFTDEVTVYAVMWAVMIAWGGVSHSRNHVRADLVLHVMTPLMRHLAEIAANLVGFAFALFLGWYGYLIAYEAWDFGDLSPTNIRFPLWIYYAALPIGALLMAIGHLRVAIALILGDPADTQPSRGEEV